MTKGPKIKKETICYCFKSIKCVITVLVKIFGQNKDNRVFNKVNDIKKDTFFFKDKIR